MSFWILYIIALLPLALGGYFWYRNPTEFTWKEWIVSAVFAFVVAGVFHIVAVQGATDDRETWSGKITSVQFQPKWLEYYEETHSYTTSSTDSKGNVTTTTHYYTVDYTKWHEDSWYAYTDLPGVSYDVDYQRYLELKKDLGDTVDKVAVRRRTWRDASKLIKGDPHDYNTKNTSGVIIPITAQYSFENRVKAASTLFSFPAVPEKIKLPDYPEYSDAFRSNRLIGSAVAVNLRKFDEFNTRLGYSKKVNVILVGLNGASEAYGRWLEAKWLGGKKNDLVIVWSGSNKKPDWVHAFSWTDKKTVLRILEEVALKDGISTETLPLFEKEIREYYRLKNWKDFDYIQIPIRKGIVYGYLVFTLVSQVLLMWWFHRNEFTERADPYGAFFKTYYGGSKRRRY